MLSVSVQPAKAAECGSRSAFGCGGAGLDRHVVWQGCDHTHLRMRLEVCNTTKRCNDTKRWINQFQEDV